MVVHANGSRQLYGESCGGNGYFGIWLKAEYFSVADRNLIPTGTSLISAGCVVLWGFLSDYFQSRFAFVIIPLVSRSKPCHKLEFSTVTNKSEDFRPYPEWDPRFLATESSPKGVCLLNHCSAADDGGIVWLPLILYLLYYVAPSKFANKFLLRSYSWANEVCADDNEERAVVVSSMNGFQYAVAAWLPILIFTQTMAPTFRKCRIL